ncbi:hypothetical protein NM208_g8495 [Fusarium decemcellulare]|uniref:Uncharacterized protein n=1 Tax=Fusarium decemcellulare TaxID=57161 RepID=A0ACC1S539_9HYPO|nr:hypothetical protein NM208_g8495 [Fusarium decemcellulare]
MGQCREIEWMDGVSVLVVTGEKLTVDVDVELSLGTTKEVRLLRTLERCTPGKLPTFPCARRADFLTEQVAALMHEWHQLRSISSFTWNEHGSVEERSDGEQQFEVAFITRREASRRDQSTAPCKGFIVRWKGWRSEPDQGGDDIARELVDDFRKQQQDKSSTVLAARLAPFPGSFHPT